MKSVTGISLVVALTISICLSSCKKDEPAAPVSYYSISGRVYSAKDTSEYLQGVLVYSGNQTDTTDKNGLYHLESVAGGRITLSFHYPGFRNKDTVISLSAGMNVSAGLTRVQPDVFPNETGYTWKYLVIDSLYNRTDTVLVKITGNGLLWNGRKGKIWQYTGQLFPQNNSYKNTAAAFSDTFFVDTEIEYVLPLNIGQKWYQHTQTTEVQAVENVTTYAGTFISCYRLQSDEVGDNFRYHRTYWFAPRIGIVKQSFSVYSLSRGEKSTWLLLDYKLE